MRIDPLKDFQETAIKKIAEQVYKARREATDGDDQAIVLSSPTGSGKTVILIALMERIIKGDGVHVAQPDATFLWLSDSPQLNEQSRRKVERLSDVIRVSQIVQIDNGFSQKILDPGRLYFLNTQKLGKESLLTKRADGRDYTIWETIENTRRARPGSFYVLIDEAHRGMTESAKSRHQADTIVQRFIKGDRSVGISPIPLIIGMSATPGRFEKLLEGVQRTRRNWDIPPRDVMVSGLIKERISVFFPEAAKNSEWTLLAAAVDKWVSLKAEWKRYCKAEREALVRPILVIQVEDGRGDSVTATSLEKVLSIVSRVAGELPSDAFAHAFDSESDLTIGRRQIRHIEASKIQDDEQVEVIFFKTALATGWDCPRAETMMSFRRAKDATYIAQLVGRMLRTPLARRIDRNDALNSAGLFLPYFDRPTIQTIIEKLRKPEDGEAVPVEVEDGEKIGRYEIAADKTFLLESARIVPTYSMTRSLNLAAHQRLLKFARHLSIYDRLDDGAYRQAQELIVKVLAGEASKLSGSKSFKKILDQGRAIEVREVGIEAGIWREVSGGSVRRISPTPENIDALFDECDLRLGEGIKELYWKKRSTKKDPNSAKLELHAVLQRPDVWDKLNHACSRRADELYDRYKARIRELPEGARDKYKQIRRADGASVEEELSLPEVIEAPRIGRPWKKHLYVDASGDFHWDANAWEEPVLREELGKGEVLGWLRNAPRKEWALCVPFGVGQESPFYPDLLIFRRKNKKIVIDIIDPHNPDLADGWEKVCGLARYAEKHEAELGRVEAVFVDKGMIRRIDLTKETNRSKIFAIRSNDALKAIFRAT